VDFAVVATVFVLIVPAELPDKTFVASLILATRFRAIPVFVGAAAGLAVQAAIAVAAGSLVSLLPETLVKSISAAVFGFGAILMYRVVSDPAAEEAEVDEVADKIPTGPSDLRVIATSFLVLFVAEWGDLTQLLTASLSAKYHQPLSVFLGSFLGLVTVALLAVTGGKAILRVIPLGWIRRIAAAALATIAVVTALQAAKLI
jgi:Ca2+/H+ antiporter, TMEM165/GDT1 family